MKKLLVLLLLMAYTVANAGVSLNYFYCCGKLKSVSFTPRKATPKKCSRMAGSNKRKCCENKVVTFQLKSDQKQADEKSGNTCFKTVPVSDNPGLPAELFFVNVTGQFQLSRLATPVPKKPLLHFPSRQICFSVFRI